MKSNFTYNTCTEKIPCGDTPLEQLSMSYYLAKKSHGHLSLRPIIRLFRRFKKDDCKINGLGAGCKIFKAKLFTKLENEKKRSI